MNKRFHLFNHPQHSEFFLMNINFFFSFNMGKFDINILLLSLLYLFDVILNHHNPSPAFFFLRKQDRKMSENWSCSVLLKNWTWGYEHGPANWVKWHIKLTYDVSLLILDGEKSRTIDNRPYEHHLEFRFSFWIYFISLQTHSTLSSSLNLN